MASRSRLAVGLAAAIIALGVFFRFYNLDLKIVDNDEATTSLRASGYTLADFLRTFDGQIRTVAEIGRYQRPGDDTSDRDTIESLAVEDPQHAPLYYLIERHWIEAVGDSVFARRFPAAVFGGLAVVAAIWLGYELFGSLRLGLTAGMLLAVSPIQVIYSQDNREYSLWLLCIVVSASLLLRALRTNAVRDWALYTLGTIAGLYSDVLFLYVLGSYVVFGFTIGSSERRSTLTPLGIATIVALLAFSPWLLALYHGMSLVTNNTFLGAPISPKVFLLKWIFNIGALFMDVEYTNIRFAALLLPILGSIVWSAIVLWRGPNRRVPLFIVTLIGVTMLALVLPDALRHESRSTAPRYAMPVWLGIDLCLANLLDRLQRNSKNRFGRPLGAAMLAVLVGCAVLSDWHDSAARATWAAAAPASLAPIAAQLNAANHPLVVYVADPAQWDFSEVQLTTLLRPDIRFRLFLNQDVPALGDSAGDVFLLDPTPGTWPTVKRTTPGPWHLLFVQAVGGSVVGSLRREAAASRRAGGFTLYPPSLWKLAAR